MQNIFIMHNPLSPEDPCDWVASPVNGNIWRNDQGITWKILDPSGLVTWGDPPFVFDDNWTLDGGTLPEPLDNPGGQPLYTATGPGRNDGPGPRRYHYEIYIVVPNCPGTIRVGLKPTNDTAVDPDVWNQPQP